MNNIYKSFKEGGPLSGVAKVSAILIMIMVWILIDKGNIYGQNLSLEEKLLVKNAKGSGDQVDLLQKSNGGKGGILDEGSGSDEDNSFVVFPNPVDGDLVFDFEFTVRTGVPYEVLDAQGKLVDRGVIEPGVDQHSLDMRKLKAGLYILWLDLGGKPQVKRVVKK